MEDVSSGSGNLAEGEQDEKEGAELWGLPGSNCVQSCGTWGGENGNPCPRGSAVAINKMMVH